MKRRAACAIALGAAGLLAAIAFCRPQVPDFAAVRARWRPSDAQLLDRHGEPLHELRVDAHGRRLAWTPLAAISPALQQAVIASEDHRFRSHLGVDFAALAGAAAYRLAGRRSRGASTLTMQLAALLDPRIARAGVRQRTAMQKLRQLLAALALERRWSKPQILEAYLNLVAYRGEIEGVAAASRVMFDKAPQGIDAAEAVVLAALIRAPNARAAALWRRAEALRAALAAGAAAPDAPGASAVRGAVDRAVAARARDFTRVTLAPRVAEQLLRDGTLSAQSTLDRDLQGFALDALRRHVAEVHERNVDDGAVVVVENATGEVWAYVGGTGALSSAPYVDGVRAMRQPGSALKPFLYALAFERRLLTPASLLEDTPLELPESRGLYRPLDYDREFRGLVSTRVALASSLNVPAVRTIGLVGVEAFAGQLRQLGFQGIVEQGDYYGAALALGSADVRLWDLVNAYRTLANGGRYSAMRLSSGGGAPQPARQIYSPATAFLISDILADRASRAATFGLENALATRYWSAVKTGTSKDMRDNWCVGYTGRFTVGVWVGNFSGASMHDVTGISGAAPVWLDVMNYLDQRFAGGEIARPPGVTARTVEFPNAVEPAREEWFLAGTEPNRRAAHLDDTARILSPAPDTVIAFDPDIPADRQRVTFVASAGAGGARWMLDHRALGPAGGVMLWTPAPGEHTLALADSAGHLLDTARFRVRGGAGSGLRGLGK